MAPRFLNGFVTFEKANCRFVRKCDIRSYCERCPGLAWMEGGDLLGAYERRRAPLAEQKSAIGRGH